MANVVDTAKIVYDLAMKGKTLELQEQVMQLREQALELQEENLRLKTENLELKKKLDLQETLKFRRKVYWREGDAVPFCPYCFEKSKLPLHLSGPEPWGNQHVPVYSCQECKLQYTAKGEEDFRIWR